LLVNLNKCFPSFIIVIFMDNNQLYHCLYIFFPLSSFLLSFPLILMNDTIVPLFSFNFHCPLFSSYSLISMNYTIVFIYFAIVLSFPLSVPLITMNDTIIPLLLYILSSITMNDTIVFIFLYCPLLFIIISIVM